MDIYIFNNGIITEKGMSGSDRRSLHWSKIFKQKDCNITLFIPQVGVERYKDCDFNFVITSHMSPIMFGFLGTYIIRAIKGCILQPKISEKSIIYSSSDLIADSIPAIYMKLRSKSSNWISGLHLLAPNPFKGFTGKKKFPSLPEIYYFLSQRFILMFMKRYASLVLVSNNLDKKFLIEKGFRINQILVTFGAIDTNEIPDVQIEIKYDACFVGRFHVQKGLFDLIEIWKHVCKKKHDARLAIVGEGSLMDELVFRIEKDGLSKNIIFHGFLDGRQKFEVIKSSSVFVFPSTYESFGMAALEAMACGVPVVAYSLEIFQEIYPKGMIKVPFGDIDSFADTVLELLYDDKKKNKIGLDAYELSMEYTWEKTANEIMAKIGVI